MGLDHDDVARRAAGLIKRLHGCTIGALDFSGGWMPERVDALLFNSSASFMIEAKVSRGDFLADRNKPSRKEPESGVGKYRYYACPEGLISPDELPDRWGLIYIPAKRKGVTMPVGFGGHIKRGEEPHPQHGWTRPVFEHFGTPEKDEIRSLEWAEFKHHPERIANRFAFERDRDLESRYLYALATRYKAQKFMDNML